MSLDPKTKLAEYEIVAAIGAGGMGEVYRARDTKLQRDVAVKVLPDPLARDAERLARFEREAKLLAALNHPGIATIHGLEKFDGTHFLVMELVEGETLAERIARGPIPVDEAIELFTQIAEALDAAHEKGIVHRDLKPANIMITPEGRVKVLDFGLAKVLQEDAPADDASQSPTLPRLREGGGFGEAGTELGVILGTASYMSPEQARGKNVDKKTDVWAFGCCLYEALTGRKVFHGETATDTMAKVVHNEPDWENVPPAAVRLLKRCLSKQTRGRLHDIADVRIELESIAASPADAFHKSPVARHRWPVLLMAGALGLAAGVLLSRQEPSPEVVERRLHMRLGDARIDGAPVLSPDGSVIVFRAGDRYFMRRLDEERAEPLSTRGSVTWTEPFFSPDGKWIGISDAAHLFKVSIDGGPPSLLAQAGYGTGTWGDDGYLYYSMRGGQGIYRVSADGGEPEEVTRPDVGTHIQPEVLPGSKALLYVVFGAENQPTYLEVLSIESGERKTLLFNATTPRFAPTGHLVFERDGALMATPFDPRSLEIKGDPITIEEGVAGVDDFYGHVGAFSFSGNGLLAYRKGGSRAARELVWVDRDGAVESVGLPPGEYGNPTLSPDARSVGVEQSGHLWIYELARKTRMRLTSTFASGAVWTPDGRHIVFSADQGGTLNLFWRPVDGSGPAEPLTESSFVQIPNNVSGDGRLAFFQTDEHGTGNIWTLELNGDAAPEPFLTSPDYGEFFGHLSPDGQWMVYVSEESGQSEVYVRPFPGPGRRYPVSVDGGSTPRWSRDGAEVYYWSRDRMMTVRNVSTTLRHPRAAFSEPRLASGDS